MLCKYLFISCLILCTYLPILAHGDVHEQINRLTADIVQDDENAHLYYLRGQYYHQHGDFEDALDDFQCALLLDPDLQLAKLSLAELFLDFDQAERALHYIEDYLKNHPPKALKGIHCRAKIYLQLNAPRFALKDYKLLLELSPQPQPEHYIEYAHCALKVYPKKYLLAIDILEKGTKKLGNIITLQSELIDIALAHKDYTLALKKVEEILHTLKRKEKWLAKKGAILQANQQFEKAQTTYQQALEAIEKLPERHRNTPAIKDLEQEISQKLSL